MQNVEERFESAHGNDGCDSSSNFEEPYKYSPYKN
jgi:hypothetical protein